MAAPSDGALSALPQLLRSDPALPLVLGAADATLAVAAPAQPILVAALAHFTERAPVLVVAATEVDAVRLADDLACFLRGPPPSGGEDDGTTWAVLGALNGPVAMLPAWETLPFERVSPEVETMGRRLAILWALTHHDQAAEGFGPPASSCARCACCSGWAPTATAPRRWWCGRGGRDWRPTR